MKTIKFLAVVCFILAFSANIAISQKVMREQTLYVEYTQDRIPCLTETVSGYIIEIQSITNNTYHVRPRGVLYGETSGEEYDISYEYNSVGFDYGYNPLFGSGRVSHFAFPIKLKHDGKLVAVIFCSSHVVYDGERLVVKGRWIEHVNCK